MLVEIDEKEVVSESVAAENLLCRIWRIGMVSMIIAAAVILMGVSIAGNISKQMKLMVGELAKMVGSMENGGDDHRAVRAWSKIKKIKSILYTPEKRVPEDVPAALLAEIKPQQVIAD